MDRRAAFFVAAAAVCAILIPVTEHQQRWVPAALVVTYLLLAVASWADHRTRSRGPTQPTGRSHRAKNSPSEAESTSLS
jgi:hypothetical protein